MNVYQNKRRFDQVTSYALGHVERLIEDIARSNAVSSHELTVRLAELLRLQTNGSFLGSADSMPGMRPASTQRAALSQSEVEMDDGARNHRSPKVSRKGFSYEGTHWTQQPENKERLRRQMVKNRRKIRR